MAETEAKTNLMIQMSQTDAESKENTSGQIQTAIATSDTSKKVLLSVERKWPIQVGLAFIIDQLCDINTVTQEYKMVGTLSIDWEATKQDYENWLADPVHFVPGEFPSLDIRNVVEHHITIKKWKGDNVFCIRPGDSNRESCAGKYFNFHRWEITALFSEQFELENFPLDVQDLSFCFQGSAGWGANKAKLCPTHVLQQSFMIDLTYSALADWDYAAQDAIFRSVDWRYEKWLIEDVTGGWHQSTAIFRLQFKRKPLAVLVRILLWMGLLAVLTFATFSIHISKVAERLSYAVTLILAVVAFQFVVANQLPQVPYLTIVDKYNFVAFGYITAIIIETSILGWGLDENDPDSFDSEELEKKDTFCAYGFAIAFVVSQLLFIIYSWFKYKSELWKIGKTPQEIARHVADEEGFDMKKFLNLQVTPCED